MGRTAAIVGVSFLAAEAIIEYLDVNETQVSPALRTPLPRSIGAKTSHMRKLHIHCGCCSQCLDRRFSVLAAETKWTAA
jgi:hypothetical protein